MDWLHYYENQYASSSEPAKQLSINNEGRFTLTKALKLRSEVTEWKKTNLRVNTITKMQMTLDGLNIP